MNDSQQHYRHNHYVPIWYQRRFMLPGQSRYYRLDLAPESVRTWNEKKQQHVKYTRRDQHHWSPEKIFAADDLYTVQWGPLTNTEVEQFFFGRLDHSAQAAFDYFADFRHPSAEGGHFHTFLRYISVQKLRTPKGLATLSKMARSSDKNINLLLLQQVQDIYCAIWTECVWTVASAEQSLTKFIISDHPVTVYNRACPPLSKWCKGADDPDIRLHATHTYLPLSLDKVLILTNLSWVRDPYQNELRFRPNPEFFRGSLFNFTRIQTDRFLTEDEVLQINYVTKRRAHRYIAAAEQEWLYPERHVSTDHWKKLGGGYLFMPEPRLLSLGGQVVVGYKDGSSDAFSEYGHRPWQPGYEDKNREAREQRCFYRFQAEWASMHGPRYKARCFQFGSHQIRDDSEETTEQRKRTLARYRRRGRDRQSR